MEDDANSVALSNITLKEIVDVINKYRTRPLKKNLGTQQLNIDKPKNENIFETKEAVQEEPIDNGMDYEEGGERPTFENRRNWPAARREIRDDDVLISSEEEDNHPEEQRVPPFVNAYNARQKYISSVPDIFRSRLEDIQENFIQVKRHMQDFEHYERLVRSWLISNVGKENCNLRGVVDYLTSVGAPISLISHLHSFRDKGNFGNESIAPLRALDSYNERLAQSYNTIREKWVETQREIKEEMLTDSYREANYINQKSNVNVVEDAAQIKDIVSIFNELKDTNQKTIVKMGTVIDALNNFLVQFPTNKANNPNEDKLTPAITRLTNVLDSIKNNQIQGDLDSIVVSLKAIAAEAKVQNTRDKKTVDLDVKAFTSALDELISKLTSLGNGVANVDTQLRTFTATEQSLVSQLITNLENKLTPIKNESITKALEALSNSISSSLAVAPQLSNIIKALDNISTKLDSTVNKHQISFDNYNSIKDYIDKLTNAHKQMLDDLSKKNEAATNNAFTSISQTQNNYSPDMKQLSVIVTKSDLAILIKEAYVAANLQLNNVSEDFINRFYELFMQKKKKEEEEEARYRGPKDLEPNIYNTKPPGPPPPGSSGGLFSSLLGRSNAKADEILNTSQSVDSVTLRKSMLELSELVKQIPKKIEIDDVGLRESIVKLTEKISQIPADIRHQVEIPDVYPQVTVDTSSLVPAIESSRFPQDVAKDIKDIKGSLQKLSNTSPIPPIKDQETTNEIIKKLNEWLNQNRGMNLIDFEARINSWWSTCVETTIVSKTTLEKALLEETITNWKNVTTDSISRAQKINELSIENHSKKIETVISEYFSKNSVQSAQLIRKDIGEWFEINKTSLLANVKMAAPTVNVDAESLYKLFAGWWNTVQTSPAQSKALLELTETKKLEVLSEIQNEIKIYIKGAFNDPEFIKRQTALEFELKNEMQNRRIAELQAEYIKKQEELNAEYSRTLLSKKQELFEQQQAMIAQMNEQDRLFYNDKQKKRQELENEIQALELAKQQQEGQNVSLDATTQSKLDEHRRVLNQLNIERSQKEAEVEQFKLNAQAAMQNLKLQQEQSALVLRSRYDVEVGEAEQIRRKNEELRERLFAQEQIFLKNEEDMKARLEHQKRKQEKTEHAERFGNMLLKNYSNIAGLEESAKEIQIYIDLLKNEDDSSYDHLIKTSERFKRQIQQRLLYLSAENYGLQFISERIDSLSREPVCVIRNEEGMFNILPIPQGENSPQNSFLFVPSLTEYINERRSNNNMALSEDPTRSGKALYDDINNMLRNIAIRQTVTMDDVANLMSRNKEGWKAFTYEDVEGQPTDLYVNILKRLRDVVKNNHTTSDIADMSDAQQGVILATLNNIISEKERMQASDIIESALVDNDVVRRYDPFNSHRALTYTPPRAIEYSPANPETPLNSDNVGVLATIAKPPQNTANVGKTNAPTSNIPKQLAIETPTNDPNSMEVVVGKLVNKKDYADDTVTSKKIKGDSTKNLINQPPASNWALVPYKPQQKSNMELVLAETLDSVMNRPISELRQRLRMLFYNLEKSLYVQSEMSAHPDLDYYNFKMDNFRLVKKIKSIIQNIETRINREITDKSQRSEIDSEMFKYSESLKKFGRATEMSKNEFSERIRLTKKNYLPGKIERAEDEEYKIRKIVEDLSNKAYVVENSRSPMSEKLAGLLRILDELHMHIKSMGGYENLYSKSSDTFFNLENRLISRISSMDYAGDEIISSDSYIERPGFVGFKKEYGIDFIEEDNSSSTLTVDPLTGEPIKINTKVDGKKVISSAPQARKLFDDVFGDQSVPVVGEPGSSTIPSNNSITDNNRTPNEEAEPIYYKPVVGPTLTQANKLGYPASIIRPAKLTPPSTPSRSTDVEQMTNFEGEDEVTREFNEEDAPDILNIKREIKSARAREKEYKRSPITTRPATVAALKQDRAKQREKSVVGDRTGNGFKKGLVNKMRHSGEKPKHLTLKRMDKIHGAMKNYFAKTTFHPKKPLSKLKIAKKIVDDYYDKYNSNREKEPKDINCGHCGKGIDLDDDSDNKKFHLANTGEVMHRECFKNKGCTPNRTLYKRGFGFDVEHNSSNEKAKTLAKEIDTFKAHHKLANQKYPTIWEEFYASAKSSVPNIDKFLSAAKERNMFYGRFNERRLNELVFLLGFANNKLEDTRNNSEREQIIENIEVGIAKFLQTRDYKKTNSTYLPTSNFSKLKNKILNNPGILHNLDF